MSPLELHCSGSTACERASARRAQPSTWPAQRLRALDAVPWLRAHRVPRPLPTPRQSDVSRGRGRSGNSYCGRSGQRPRRSKVEVCREEGGPLALSVLSRQP
eukprot:scaffold223356_cov26-Tisochrysis_lutea.AAC.2